jgi:ATP-dependent Lhr-like helicase
MIKHPPDILVTTPESLYLMLGSKVRDTFRTVNLIILDEIHVLGSSKRGVHLALSLERLALLATDDPQRIGLSATVHPVDEVARYLGGDREVEIIDTTVPPRLELTVEMPDPALTVEAAADSRPEDDPTPGPDDEIESEILGALPEGTSGGSILGRMMTESGLEPKKRSRSIWPAVQGRLLQLIDSNRTTIVFVNNRSTTERLVQQLNELRNEELSLAHHGSLSRKRREEVEDRLKGGTVRSIIATSSLELGIDMGTVDLVVMVESPAAVSRGLQRVGRAGHGVGETSRGVIIPKYRGDLVECAVVSRGMLDGKIEAMRVPKNALDVLAQQIVAMCVVDDRNLNDLKAIARRSYCFQDISDTAFDGVVDMLAGRYPSTDFADLRARLTWDRTTDVLSARRGARMVAMTNAGTIPDRGLYGVHIAPDGPRIGELDEEMVHEARPGQTFVLGASTWRIEDITRDRVLVSPAPGEPGQLPFWRGTGPGRPIQLGRAIGAFLREVEQRKETAEEWLASHYPLDSRSRTLLLEYIREQQESTTVVPSDTTIVVERFRDEIGDLRICILSPFGSRVHAPWAMALEAQMQRRSGFEVSTLWSDDGISFRVVDEVENDAPRGIDQWIVDPEELEDLVVEQLANTALFAGVFRENASRSLLLPRNRPGKRTPLWAQRMKSQGLLAVARQYPSFPIILETYRTCLQDVFDLPALNEILRGLQSRKIRIVEVDTERPSPFARSLAFDYVAAWLYEGDAPLAERRAQALTLDRDLLRELLGHAELRDLLDPDAIADVEAELQCMADGYRATDADQLVDILRKVGDLSADELAARCEHAPEQWLETLLRQIRVVSMRVAGKTRFVAAEHAALLRDAVGSMPPAGISPTLLEPVQHPIRQLAVRYAKTHGPFTTKEFAQRYQLRPAQAEPVLIALMNAGRIVRGELRPLGNEREWCDENVLKRIRRRSLARLRGQAAPVGPEAYGRFLPAWHGIVGNPQYLEEALIRLEGMALPFSEMEQRILPARVDGFRSSDLDLLTATGQWIWVGAGALGSKDGKVKLYRREKISELHQAPNEPPQHSDIHQAITHHLATHGASFLFEIRAAMKNTAATETVTALWDLVWAGLITNDTLQPLRSLGRATAKRRPRSRRAAARSAGGRWSLVYPLLDEQLSDTEREHSRALTLLERHGILSRTSTSIEELHGGFSTIYSVLKNMDELGRVRRGYFVEGLLGAQFASPGAIERLREVRDPPTDADIVALAACDPANPWGASLSWPGDLHGLKGPKRTTGSTVVLIDGTPWLWLSKTGRALCTFPELEDCDDIGLIQAAIEAAVEGHPRMPITVEKINGESALDSPLMAVLVDVGFYQDIRGARYDRKAR